MIVREGESCNLSKSFTSTSMMIGRSSAVKVQIQPSDTCLTQTQQVNSILKLVEAIKLTIHEMTS